MTSGNIIRNPISTLKNIQGCFSCTISDNHDHFITSCTVQKWLFIIVFDVRHYKARKSHQENECFRQSYYCSPTGRTLLVGILSYYPLTGNDIDRVISHFPCERCLFLLHPRCQMRDKVPWKNWLFLVFENLN